MKITTFLFISLLFSCTAWTQEFAPEEALWHYSFLDFDPEVISYATIESKADTVIDDVSCMKMLEVHRLVNDTINTKWHYMYSRNDSVFFYEDGSFHLLYDFGAEEGDTIKLEYFQTYDGTPLEMIVDSVSFHDFGGIIKKVQHVTCIETIVIDFGPMIIEDIGRTRSMFPTYDGQTSSMRWRCYEDGQSGLLLNPFNNGIWNGQDCEQIITSTEEIDPVAAVSLAPNPANRFIYVKGKEIIKKYSLTDESGRLMLNNSPNTSKFQIDMQSLPQGIYFLKLSVNETILIKKILKL